MTFFIVHDGTKKEDRECGSFHRNLRQKIYGSQKNKVIWNHDEMNIASNDTSRNRTKWEHVTNGNIENRNMGTKTEHCIKRNIGLFL